jgi:hypothetical protein
MINHSQPGPGSTNWFQGNPDVFAAQAGDPNAYIAANFNNGTGTATLSNWLLMPNLTLENGDTLTFYTRTVTSVIFPDRLQVRLSTNGSSSNVGTTATDVGDFTTVLLDINPTYTLTGYPNSFGPPNPFVVTISGLGGPTSGRLALRYFVEDGGPGGDNSSYIGIDTLSYSGTCNTPTPTITPGGPTLTPTSTRTPTSTPTITPTPLSYVNYCVGRGSISVIPDDGYTGTLESMASSMMNVRTQRRSRM